MRIRAALSFLTVVTLGQSALSQGPSQADDRSTLAARVQTLTRDSAWTLVTTIPLKFDAHHPQGMVKIGDALFVSSVEIKVRTTRFPAPVNGMDRDAGEGVGHLYKVDMEGNLVVDLKLGEGAIYHPGGIDFDGSHIWVPVAEYRPNSRSILYKIDPRTLTATAVLGFADHIGAIVHDTDAHALYGVSWGSRRFYTWTLDADGRVTNAAAPPESLRALNPSHYIDYQDCKYAGGRRMVCTGVTEIRQSPNASVFRLGGIELVDLRDRRPVHQTPLLRWTPSGLDITHNAAWLEPTASGLRGYFLPEDGRASLYVYELKD
jgi:Family of unknown function (DUF6454)